MLIKVCGLKREEDIADLSKLDEVDFLGFINVSQSPRYVGRSFKIPETSKKTVVVFRNSTLDEVKSVQERMKFDYIQLHGDETVDYCRSISAITKTLKAFSIQNEQTFRMIEKYDGICELFIFDTPSKLGGGSGKKFDWDMLRNYKGNTPFLLSGGIGPQDIDQLRKIDHPKFIGVDINSRFEERPAEKDTALIQAFLNELDHEVIS